MSRRPLSHFRIVQEADVDGLLRLTLLGELDIAAADELTICLRSLRGAGEHVRIDLSKLEFIDVRGFAAIRDAVQAGRSSSGGGVELAATVSRPVRRLFDLLGVSGDLVAGAGRPSPSTGPSEPS